jgi:hypothetical protein
MPPRFVIEIRAHRYGWTCQEPFGPERVFILKPQAIEFAQRQCAAFSAEIRVRDRNGAIERTLRLEPSRESVAA